MTADNRPGKGASYQPKKDYQPAITSQELGVMVNKGVNTLLEAIQSGKTENFTNYLAFSARFHKYSRRNQILIFEQCPSATKVASYATWKKEGYQVRKMREGEHGIRILVPIPPAGFRREKRNRESEEQQPGETEAAFVTRRFKVGTVFDKTHLIPEDQVRVPDLFQNIEGDHKALHERLIKAVEIDGIKYEESLETYGARGYSAGGKIVVREDLAVGNKVAVTIHEFSHELLHKEQERRELPKQVKECHAESTAFIVAQHFGITIPYSSDYLINWGNDTETLKKELDLVTYAASEIIKKVEAIDEANTQNSPF